MHKLPFKFKRKLARPGTLWGICLFFAAIIAVSSDAAAQCKHITIHNGEAKITNIPCDFPVLIETGSAMADQEKFKMELARWVKNNRGTEGLQMSPGQVSGSFIQIPTTRFMDFSPDKKLAIESKKFFYQTIK